MSSWCARSRFGAIYSTIESKTMLWQSIPCDATATYCSCPDVTLSTNLTLLTYFCLSLPTPFLTDWIMSGLKAYMVAFVKPQILTSSLVKLSKSATSLKALACYLLEELDDDIHTLLLSKDSVHELLKNLTHSFSVNICGHLTIQNS